MTYSLIHHLNDRNVYVHQENLINQISSISPLKLPTIIIQSSFSFVKNYLLLTNSRVSLAIINSSFVGITITVVADKFLLTIASFPLVLFNSLSTLIFKHSKPSHI